MRIEHIIEQNSEEWLQLRKGLITASTFSDFFQGESTAGYQNAIARVAAERCGIEIDTFLGNEDTEKGHEFEIVMREQYEIINSTEIKNGNFWTYGDWCGASPDGQIEENGLWENKSKTRLNTILNMLIERDKNLKLTEKSNKQHFWQVHFQLYVTGKDFCDYQVGSDGFIPFIVRVYRDEEIIKRIESKLEEVIPKIKRAIELFEKYKL